MLCCRNIEQDFGSQNGGQYGERPEDDYLTLVSKEMAYKLRHDPPEGSKTQVTAVVKSVWPSRCRLWGTRGFLEQCLY